MKSLLKIIEDRFGFWRADSWLHYNLKCGAGSIFMIEKDMLTFSSFLLRVYEEKNFALHFGSIYADVKGENFSFTHEGFDKNRVNIIISGDNTVIIFNFHEDDLIYLATYFKDKAEDAE
jgi:hypothetical protein